MKKLLTTGLLIIGLVLAFSTNGFAQTDELEIGGGLVLSTGALNDFASNSSVDNTFGLKIDGAYAFDEQWRGAADFTFYFPEKESGVKVTVWELNFNAHYLITEENDLKIYGLGGLNITNVDIDIDGSTAGNSESEFGLNLGGGLQYPVDFADVFGELKFAGIGGDADQLVFTAGLRFDI